MNGTSCNMFNTFASMRNHSAEVFAVTINADSFIRIKKRKEKTSFHCVSNRRDLFSYAVTSGREFVMYIISIVYTPYYMVM